MTKIPDDILLWAYNSISGEVTPNMRMIAFSYGDKRAKFRFYMSEEPTELEREVGEVIAVNFDSGLSGALDQLDVEFIVSDAPLGKLDSLDKGIFRRWEK